MKVDKYKIKPSKVIKLLELYINCDLNWDTEIGKLCANLHNRICNINKIKRYTTFKIQIQFINAYLLGKMSYLLLIYMNINGTNIPKLYRVLMKAARVSIGNYCSRSSISQILNKCKYMK